MRQPWLHIVILIPLAGCAVVPVAERPPVYDYAALPLAHCSPEMDQPEYWIQKYLLQDQLLLTEAHIRELNKQNYARGLLTDVFTDKLWDYRYTEVERPGEDNPEWDWNLERPSVFSPGAMEGYTLYTYLKDETERIKRRLRWDREGRPVSTQTFDQLDDNLNLYALREKNPVRYGITLRRTNVRYYPTDLLVTGKRWDIDFDIIQVSQLRALEPVALLHTSKDGSWVFVVTAFCRGWIKRGDVLEDCKPGDIRNVILSEKRIVITGHAVQAISAPGNTETADTYYMGTSFPWVETTPQYYVVGLPVKKADGTLGLAKAYIDKTADVSEGYLPCTPRALCLQTFKLMHTPYSWGGKEEYRDCSQLIMDVYATMGLSMPRNSSAQAMVGRARSQFNKEHSVSQRRAVLDSINQPAILQFPGHIMLYLGREGECYYAIHDIWAYRIPDHTDKDRKVIIGKVVVSDLSLGEGSSKGSLLERITTISLVRP
ncbi:SH3 domain-containing protein [candidate division FCPU426 bacterium]|nr:SH3 domain-containing protein [candidate division FCPU426 bacterium]